MKAIAWLVVGAAVVSNACVVVTAPPPANKAQVVVRPSANGKPASVDSAQSSAFWIWHEGGGQWKLRTTTGGKPHHFIGQVSGHRDAKITGSKAVRAENNDKIKLASDRIAFDFSTGAGIDGINFTVEGRCVDFNLQIDGAAHPEHIVVGAAEQRPREARFTACP